LDVRVGSEGRGRGFSVASGDAYLVSGYVMLVNGSAVEGAYVNLYGMEDFGSGRETDEAGYYELYVGAGTYNFHVWPGHRYEENFTDFKIGSLNVTSDRFINVTLYPRYSVDLELDEEFVYLGGTLGVTLNITLSLGEHEVSDEWGTYWEEIAGPPVVGLNSSQFSAWVHNSNYQYSEMWWSNPVENDYHDYWDSLNVTEVSDGIYEFNFTVPNRMPYNDTDAYWLDLEVLVANNEAWRGFSVMSGDVYTISGTVYNESMHVIPYAEIDVVMGMEWGTSVEADEFGNYSVLVPAGNYSMTFFGPEDGDFYLPSFIEVEVDSNIVQDAVLTSLPDEFTMVFVSREIDGNTTNLGQVVLDTTYSLPHVVEVTPEAPLGDVDPMYIAEDGYLWDDLRERWNSTSATLTIIFLYIEDNDSVAPYDPYPANGEENVSLSTVLSWNVSGPDVGPLTYYVFLDDAMITQQTEPMGVNITETWYPSGALDPDTLYYWMIEVFDGVNWTEGELWNFTTGFDNSTDHHGWNATIYMGVFGETDYTSLNATFGMIDGATGSFDMDSDLFLPPGFAGVESYFYYPDEPSGNPNPQMLYVSFLDELYPANWTFVVHTFSGVSGDAVMAWNVTDFDEIPGEYAVTLVTPTAVYLNMRSISEYVWSVDASSEYTFDIIIDYEP